MVPLRLIFVTGNEQKYHEAQAILGDDVVLKRENVDLPEIQGSPEDIIKEKCRVASTYVDGPFIVEDTCLCFNAMNGLPGPYIKWFLEQMGSEGVYKMLMGFNNYRAYALCTVGYFDRQLQEPLLFRGIQYGTVVPPQGSSNFGWDAIFQPDGLDVTYVHVDQEVKNTMSPRFIAFDHLGKFINSSFKLQHKQ